MDKSSAKHDMQISANNHNKKSENEEIKVPDSCLGIRHIQVVLCFLMLCIAYGMRINLSIAIVAMTDKNTTSNPDIPTYDWDDSNVVLSSFFWGYVVLQIFAGALGKNYGPRWFVVIAMLVNSIMSLIIPVVADNLGSKGVMGCRVVQGLFQGFFFPSVHNMLGKWAPAPERSRFATIAYSGASFGTMLSIPITGLISASWAGWPVSFYFFGATGFVFIAIWLLLGANSPAEHKTISDKERHYIEATLDQKDKVKVPTPWSDILKSMPVWAIVVGNFGQNWGYATLLTEIPNYLNKVMEFDMQKNSFLSAAPYLALWILSYVFGPIADWLINTHIFSRGTVRKIFNAIGTCIPAITLVSLGYVPDDQTTLSVVLLILTVGINAAVFCGFQVNHVDLAPNHAGVLMGLGNGPSQSFSILAPLMVDFLVSDEHDKTQWRLVFIVAACVYVTSAIFFCIFATGEVQSWNEKKKEEGDGEIAEIEKGRF